MADNSAQSKLGELFVDLGAKGGEGLIKQLSSVKVGFGLAAKAATKFAQPLLQVGKQSANAALNIAQSSTALATSYKEFQKLQVYLKKKGVDESLLGEVGNLRTAIYDAIHGFAELPRSFSLGLNRIGKNIGSYNGTFEDTLRLIDDIQQATKGMSQTERLSTLGNFGLSSQWAYLFDRGDFNLRNASTTVSDKEIEEMLKLREEVEELDTTIDQANTHLKAILAQRISPVLKEVNKDINQAQKGDKQAQQTLKNASKGAIIGGAGAGGAAVAGTVLGVGLGPIGWISLLVGGTIAGAAGAYAGSKNKLKQNNNKEKNKKLSQIINPDAVAFAQPERIGLSENISAAFAREENEPNYAALPPNLSTSNISSNIQINNQNNIQGQNAPEIADRIAQIDRQQLEFSRFQMQNMVGV